MLKLPLLDYVGEILHKLQLYRQLLSDLLKTSCFVCGGHFSICFPALDGAVFFFASTERGIVDLIVSRNEAILDTRDG